MHLLPHFTGHVRFILNLLSFCWSETWENGIAERVGRPFNLLDQRGSTIHQEFDNNVQFQATDCGWQPHLVEICYLKLHNEEPTK